MATLQKIRAHSEPPKKRRQGERAKPIIGPYLPTIHAILKLDKEAPRSSVTRGSEFLNDFVMRSR